LWAQRRQGLAPCWRAFISRLSWPHHFTPPPAHPNPHSRAPANWQSVYWHIICRPATAAPPAAAPTLKESAPHATQPHHSVRPTSARSVANRALSPYWCQWLGNMRVNMCVNTSSCPFFTHNGQSAAHLPLPKMRLFVLLLQNKCSTNPCSSPTPVCTATGTGQGYTCSAEVRFTPIRLHVQANVSVASVLPKQNCSVEIAACALHAFTK
jgi:hypothetical protein